MTDLDDRTLRIVETAISLAERDGYDAVRLRDIASQADVALGTVYRRFSGKEDILVAALQQQLKVLQNLLQSAPITGPTPQARMADFFDVMTRLFVLKPNLARALLRAVASGVPDIADRVVRFHGTMTELVGHALRGPGWPEDRDTEEVGVLLQNIWFADLVGWAGGINDEATIIARMARAADLLISGVLQGVNE